MGGGGGGGFRGGGGGGGFRGGGGGGRGGGGRRSDVALKHDITLLGHLDNGLGFYRFSYYGSDKAYVGVMAQEVQTVMPEAVVRGRDGYLQVFYDKLGLKFETYNHWLASGARIPTTTCPGSSGRPDVWLKSHPIHCHPGRAPLGARAGTHESLPLRLISDAGVHGSRIAPDRNPGRPG